MPLSSRHRLLVAATAIAGWSAPLLAQQDTTTPRGVRLSITITSGTSPGVLILPVNGEHGDSVRAILQRDLDYSDRIKVIATDSGMTAVSTDGGRGQGQFNYPLFTRLGAAVVIQATRTEATLHVVAHNVAQRKIEVVKDFHLADRAQTPDWRMSLHAVSDEIEQWVTGDRRGIAATRILYADARGGRIWQIDSDGANPSVVAQSQLAMSPSWHPRASHFAYVIRGQTDWQIVIKEVGGATRILNAPNGANTSPIFSPDGSTMLYHHAGESGVGNLYATSAVSSESPRRVTVGRIGTSTSPTYSPDGRQIAFASDRTGRLDIYISDADGTNAEPLLSGSYGEQLYRSDPDWSPDGRLIAFQSQIDGRFQIMTVGLRDRAPKRLTSEGINENASWAPDSRHIVFTSDRSGTRQLFIMDVESGRTRQLTHAPSGARQAAWSPPLRGR
jgi:TolB protein